MEKIEKKEERQLVLVPVRRREVIREKEVPKELPKGEVLRVPEIPRRWRIY